MHPSLRHHGWQLGLALIASFGAPVNAQAQQPAQAWQVERGKQYCAMGTGIAGATPLTFGFRMVPGTLAGQLIFARRGEGFASFQFGDKVSVTAGSSGPYEGWTRIGEQGEVRTLIIEGIDPAILSALSKPVDLSVASGDKVRLKVPFPAEGGARLAFQQCIDAAMREWGVDLNKHASLKQLPRSREKGSWIKPEDYPVTAVRNGVSGEVVIRMSIGVNGRVTNCAVVASSGNAELDATTCRLTRQRAQFAPAIGADGVPTDADAITIMRWWID